MSFDDDFDNITDGFDDDFDSDTSEKYLKDDSDDIVALSQNDEYKPIINDAPPSHISQTEADRQTKKLWIRIMNISTVTFAILSVIIVAVITAKAIVKFEQPLSLTNYESYLNLSIIQPNAPSYNTQLKVDNISGITLKNVSADISFGRRDYFEHKYSNSTVFIDTVKPQSTIYIDISQDVPSGIGLIYFSITQISGEIVYGQK